MVVQSDRSRRHPYTGGGRACVPSGQRLAEVGGQAVKRLHPPHYAFFHVIKTFSGIIPDFGAKYEPGMFRDS
jgi:hypothetical protein